MAIRETLLKVNDKTVALIGGFSSTTHMTMTLLTEQGADVALVGREQPELRRVVEHINDQREIYPHYGRAGVIGAELKEVKEAPEIIARIIHSFGRLDVLIDTLPCQSNCFPISKALVTEAFKFLTSRQKSRILFLRHHESLKALPADHEDFQTWKQQLKSESIAKNLTVNELILGITEEYLLREYPKSSSIKTSFDEVKKQWPHAKILEPYDVASWLLYLASPLSQALNGQKILLDYGTI